MENRSHSTGSRTITVDSQAPIGVFDSGMGGLTVLQALRNALPDEHFLYLGDTARLPYGTKSRDTVQRYAVQATRILAARGIKALVVACNTASAVALDELTRHYAPLPVFGVVDPGAEAAAAIAGNGRVLVLATESTVSGGAYQRALLSRRSNLQVLARPCPLLVALAEEGRHDGPLVDLVLTEYLRGGARPAVTVLLGCTHFPVFRSAIERLLRGTGAPDASASTVVDSAATTAAALSAEIAAGHLPAAAAGPGSLTLLATDGRERFQRVGRYFLGHAIDNVELVDL
ncbi:MAG: glutamate racemase [Gammaproteobacteria bacterium]|nr:glutamate racemase [Gammaproteobacteria bacterium]